MDNNIHNMQAVGKNLLSAGLEAICPMSKLDMQEITHMTCFEKKKLFCQYRVVI